jgi:hypothetical protein
MKTQYRIWEKPDGRATYREGSIHDSLDAAKAATGMPSDTTWGTNGEGNYWPDNDYRGVLFVGTEAAAESVEDRAQLAIDLIVQYGWIDGDHHKAWVMDQVVRTLAGDRYEKVVAEACADGSEWDEGVAP